VLMLRARASLGVPGTPALSRGRRPTSLSLPEGGHDALASALL